MKKIYFTQEEKKKAKADADRRYRLINEGRLKEKKRQYYLENKEQISQKARTNYLNNPDASKARSAQWKKKNAERHNANCMMRYTKKIQACPAWLTEDEKWMMEEAYHIAKIRSEMTGIKWHVDHIVPLCGKTVSGLHVPWNLQVISASENCSKRNTWK